jgi:heme/copper-type cytochrome/quinol oxidase subunit 2
LSGGRPKIVLGFAALTLGACAILPQAALADLLAPDSPASSQAEATRVAYIVAVVATLLLALAAIGALLRAARGRKGDAAETEAPRRTRGTSRVQRRVGAALGLGVLVLFVFGVVFTERARDVEASESGAEPITIQVDGQQWVWRYEYPAPEDTPDNYSADAPFTYYDLYVPVDTPITLEIGSIDVMHRWHVPALARAADAVPGDENTINFTANETGTFYGRSTEYSGAGYATMRTAVHVLPVEEFDALLAGKLEEINAARGAVQDEVEAGTAPGVALQEDTEGAAAGTEEGTAMEEGE